MTVIAPHRRECPRGTVRGRDRPKSQKGKTDSVGQEKTHKPPMHLYSSKTPSMQSKTIPFIGLVITLIITIICARYTLGNAFEVGYTQWLWGDLAQVQIAWMQFLNDPNSGWLMTDRLSSPLPISISLFDPMPIFLLMAKLLQIKADGERQYFGVYFMVCMVLQAIFGYLAAWRVLVMTDKANDFLSASVVASASALIIATMPYTLIRFQGHTALSSQWILVLAIWTSLVSLPLERFKWILVISPVLILAAGVNPYLTLMVAILFAIVNLEKLTSTGILDYLVRMTIMGAVVLLAFRAFGFLDAASTTTGGYGTYSMNILGPIDSNGISGLLSLEVPDATGGQTFEGYTYVGAGVLLLTIFAVIVWINANSLRLGSFPLMSFLIGFAVFFVIALSAKITLSELALEIPLPKLLLDIISKFRASGRFFWIAGFLLVLSGVAIVVSALGVRNGAYVMLLVVSMQIIDIQPILRSIRSSIQSFASLPVVPLKNKNVSAIYAFPPWQCSPHETPGGLRNYESIGYLAAKLGIPTNNFYAARTPVDQSQYHCDIDSRLKQLYPKAAYLFSDEIYRSRVQDISVALRCISKTENTTHKLYWICEPS